MNSPGGRVMGIDFGTVRMGLAVADLEVRIATPLRVYRRRDPDAEAAYFRDLARQQQLTRFVVGLPVHLSGAESGKSREAREFGRWLNKVTGLPVDFFDERFTTSEARQSLIATGMSSRKRKSKLDMIAARSMLEAYLEAQGRGENVQPLD